MSFKLLIRSLFLSLLILILLVSCGSSGNTTAEGRIEILGVTTFNYGTHGLYDNLDVLLYALKSDLNLDDYAGLWVTVKGDLIDGYPRNGGPEYINVYSVEYQGIIISP
ncbi:MAG: hypothetical protein JSV21_00340 [Nitrospirota bacterium]|nr:MAG: hypothetical protein JSV21_00340 [Nitrospirota bacterium]